MRQQIVFFINFWNKYLDSDFFFVIKHIFIYLFLVVVKLKIQEIKLFDQGNLIIMRRKLFFLFK